MRRYSAIYDLALSTSAATNTYPLYFTTAAAATLQVYDMMFGFDAATTVDAPVTVAFSYASAASAGTTITPTPIDQNEGASVHTVGQQCTGVTLGVALPAALWATSFNARVTARWAAIDSDSRLCLKAGLTTATSGLILNQQPGTASITLRNSVWYAE